MTRSLGLVLTLVVLCVGGYLFAQQSKSDGPTSQVAQQAETQALVDTAATNFSGVLPVLQAWYASNGTYAGAALPPGSGVTLVRADATSYCLQSGTEHEDGPNGSPAAGPC